MNKYLIAAIAVVAFATTPAQAQSEKTYMPKKISRQFEIQKNKYLDNNFDSYDDKLTDSRHQRRISAQERRKRARQKQEIRTDDDRTQSEAVLSQKPNIRQQRLQQARTRTANRARKATPNMTAQDGLND